MSADERLARLLDEGCAHQGHEAGHRRQVGHLADTGQGAEVPAERVGRVMAVELGLLEGEQVVLLLESRDAADEVGVEPDPRDEDPVERLDENRASGAGRDRRQRVLAHVVGVVDEPAHLPDHRVHEANLGGDGRALCGGNLGENVRLEDLRRVVVVLGCVDHSRRPVPPRLLA